MQQKEKEIEKLKGDVFKMSQELFKERQAEQNFVMEISGAQAASKNMLAQITRSVPLFMFISVSFLSRLLSFVSFFGSD